MSFVDRLLRRGATLDDIVGFAGGNMQSQLGQPPPQQPQRFIQSPQQPPPNNDRMIYNKMNGGFDQYAIDPGQARPRERPQDTIRRLQMQDASTDPQGAAERQAVAGQTFDGTAMFAPPGDNRNALDRGYVPPASQTLTPQNQSTITRPRTVAPQPQEQPWQVDPNVKSGTVFNTDPNAPNPYQPQPTQSATQPSPFQADIAAARTGLGQGPQSNVTRATLPDQQLAQSPFQQRLMSPTRPRVADQVGFDSQSLRDTENRPLTKRDKAGLIAQAAARALGGQPLPTRRQQELDRLGGQLNRDIGIDKEKSLAAAQKSQMDAREAAILSGQERIRQGDERLKQGQDRVTQTATLARKRNIASVYNGQREFNPDDPKNAAMVAQFQQEFGYPPPKKVSGSLLQVVEGQNADGSPSFTVIDKGTQTASQVGGDLPAQTTKQVDREQKQQQFTAAELGRNRRATQSQVGANTRAGMRQGVTGQQSAAESRQANSLVGRYNEARKLEMRTTDENIKARQRAKREALGNQIYASYPGQFEADEATGEIRAKGGQSQGGGATFNLGGWKAAHPNATADEVQATRSKAKARNLTIVE